MKNSILSQALNVSLEDLEVTEGTMELLEEHQAAAGDLTPEVYVDERIEMEQDVDVLEEAATQIENNETVSHEQLDQVAHLANAVMGRYGVSFEGTGLESSEDPAARASQLVAQIRDVNASLESSMNVAMESFALRDMWDSVGMINREMTGLRDAISVLKNYDGQTKIRLGLMYRAFTVDGEIAENLSSAAGDTAKIVDDLVRMGSEAIDAAKKAAAIASTVNWKDEEAARAGMGKIAALRNPTKDILRAFRQAFTMSNRKITSKEFTIKKGELLKEWSKGGTIKVSGSRMTTFEKVDFWLLTGGKLSVLINGTVKRKIDVKALVQGLEKFQAAAAKTQAIRNAAPKKWREHEKLVKDLKAEVTGSSEASATRRAISELDRLGWQCLNGAFTIIAGVIREVNSINGKVADKMR